MRRRRGLFILTACFAVLATACAGGESPSDAPEEAASAVDEASPPAPDDTAPTSEASAPDDTAPAVDETDAPGNGSTSEPSPHDIDHAAALLAVEDVAGKVAGIVELADEGDTAGSPLPAVCGEVGSAQVAAAGAYRGLTNDVQNPEWVLVTAVQQFDSGDIAAEGFAAQREIAESCDSYTDASGDVTFVRVGGSQPGVGGASSLLARSPITDQREADYFFLDGPFVFSVHWSVGGSFPLSDDDVIRISAEAGAKFLDWAGEQP